MSAKTTPKPTTAAARQAAGLCTGCGTRAPAPERKFCPSCLKAAREKWRSRSEARKAQGLCVRCGKVPAKPDRTECAPCAAQWITRYHHRKGAERARRTYWARVKAGLCAKCGKVAAQPGRRTCGSCLEKARTRDQAIRLERKRRGLCTECGAPSHGRRTCETCRAWKRHYDARQVLPVWETTYSVYARATGACLGTFESREDVALCLAFAKLDRDAVEIVTDAPPVAAFTGRGG